MAANGDFLKLTESTTSDPTIGRGNVLANDTGTNLRVVSFAGSGSNGRPGTWLKGIYGDLQINADGTYTYVARYADQLPLNAVGREDFTYTVVDRNGASSSASLRIDVYGTNDAPIAVGDTRVVSEDDVSVLVAANQGVLVNDRDPDRGDAIRVTSVSNGSSSVGAGATLEGRYGSLVLNSDGSYTYRPNASAQRLKAGETVSDVFYYQIKDKQDAEAVSTLTIKVQGANDKPLIVGVVDQGNLVEDVTDWVGGSLGIADVDRGESAFKPVVSQEGSYGRFSMATGGKWTYFVNKTAANVQGLAQGETVSEVFTVTSVDGSARHNVTINITGTNDAPIAVGDTQLVSEDDVSVLVAANRGVLVNDRDPDRGDAIRVTSVSNGSSSVGAGATLEGRYGSLVLNGDGSYTYRPNASAQRLKAGETVSDVFYYQIKDKQDAEAVSTLTIKVQGANDKPLILGVIDRGDLTEDVTDWVGGSLGIADVDRGESSFKPVVSQEGGYGRFSVATDGKWAYFVNKTAAHVQGLAQDQTVSEVFTVTSVDGSARHNVTIHITGTNDAPIAVANTNAITESTNGYSRYVGGDLVGGDSDPDAGTVLTVVGFKAGTAVGDGGVSGETAVEVMGAYGKVLVTSSGLYTYQLNPELSNGLAKGQTADEVFTYKISDGYDGTSATTLTIKITGTNDTPLIEGQTQVSVIEDDPRVQPAMVVYNRLAIRDADEGESCFRPVNTASEYGNLQLLSDGRWRYVLNNASPAVQALGQGDEYQDVFTVYTADGTAVRLTAKIVGTNDGPVAVADQLATSDDTAVIVERGAGVLRNDTDVDGDTLTVTGIATNQHAGVVGESLQGQYGILRMGEDGGYTYIPDPAAVADGLDVVDQFFYTASDGRGGESRGSLDVTVRGASVSGDWAAGMDVDVACIYRVDGVDGASSVSGDWAAVMALKQGGGLSEESRPDGSSIWHLDNQHSVADIYGFDIKKDTLDLRDLLGGHEGPMNQYLDLTKVGKDTVIEIMAENKKSPANLVVLHDVDLLGGASTEQQVIQELLDRGKMLLD